MKRATGPLLVLAVCSFGLAGSSSLAHADSIMGPPDDCVAGAIGESSHAGQWCTTTSCATDADCAAIATERAAYGGGDHPYVCRVVDLCVRSETYNLGGLRDRNDPQTGTREIATACLPTCEAPATCTHQKRCVRADRVVPAPSPPRTPPATPAGSAPSTAAPRAREATSTGGCAISPTGAVGAAFTLLGALALIVLRRSGGAGRSSRD